jgi:uncharacterized protein
VSAREYIDSDAAMRTREQKLETMYQNALSRDATGAVKGEQAAALAERDRCTTAACVVAWFGRREAALAQWQE